MRPCLILVHNALLHDVRVRATGPRQPEPALLENGLKVQAKGTSCYCNWYRLQQLLVPLVWADPVEDNWYRVVFQCFSIGTV